MAHRQPHGAAARAQMVTGDEQGALRHRLIFSLDAPGDYGATEAVVQTVEELDRMLAHLSWVPQRFPAQVWSMDLPVCGHDDLPMPVRMFKVVLVATPLTLGAVACLDQEGPWVSYRPWRMTAPPLLYLDSTTDAEFPLDAVVSKREIRDSLVEFAETGERPQAVPWRPWGTF